MFVLFLRVHLARPAHGLPGLQLPRGGQGQVPDAASAGLSVGRREAGRVGARGRRRSPPRPPPGLGSISPVFRRNLKHSPPPSSRAAAGNVPDGRLPHPPGRRASLREDRWLQWRVQKWNEKEGKWVGRWLFKFFLPFFFLPSFFFSFFFYSSLSKVDGWLVKENDKAAPQGRHLEGASLNKMLSILYIFPDAAKPGKAPVSPPSFPLFETESHQRDSQMLPVSPLHRLYSASPPPPLSSRLLFSPRWTLLRHHPQLSSGSLLFPSLPSSFSSREG